MARKEIGTSWDRDNRNAIQDNFIQLFNEYTGAGLDAKEARDKAMQALDISESTQEQLNQITIAGDSSVEAAQARVDEKGVSHPTLKARIDDGFNSVNQDLAQKPDKGDISIVDLNKNKIQFDETWFTDGVKEQWTGNTPINSTPASKSLTSVKYADKSVLPQHAEFISLSSNLYDQSKVTPNKIISANGTITDSDNYSMSAPILVDPNTTYHAVGAPSIAQFDDENNFIRRIDMGGASGGEFTTEDNAYYIVLNLQHGSSLYQEARLNLGSDKGYEPYRASLKDVTVHSGRILGSMSTSQRTSLGELPIFTIGQSGGAIDLDINNTRLSFTGLTFLFHRNTRYRIEAGTEVAFPEPMSSAVLIFFNTRTEEFSAINQVVVHQVSDEDNILCGIAYLSSGSWHLIINGEHTINGKPKYMPYDEEVVDDRPYRFSIDKLTVDFPQSDLPGIGEEGNPFASEAVDHTVVYGAFDDLMEINNDVTREEIGRSTNDIPIYAYHYNPETAPITSGPSLKPHPEIIMDSSIHGGENLGTYILYFFLKKICEDWTTDKGLEYLRHNIRFSIVPLPNPEDFNSGQYIGIDDINLNRDFDYNWSEREGSGTAPFSRIESQVMRDFLFANKDALLFVDLHVRGHAVTDDNATMWLGAGDPKETPILSNTIEKMTRKWKQKYPQLQSVDGQLGYISQGGAAGTVRSYAHHVVGIPSILWEGFKATPTMNDFEGKDIVDMNVQFLGETVFNSVKNYQHQ